MVVEVIKGLIPIGTTEYREGDKFECEKKEGERFISLGVCKEAKKSKDNKVEDESKPTEPKKEEVEDESKPTE